MTEYNNRIVLLLACMRWVVEAVWNELRGVVSVV